MSTERPEGVLAVALWDADNTNRLSEMPQEVNEEMVARATRALEWARRQGWELRHVVGRAKEKGSDNADH